MKRLMEAHLCIFHRTRASVLAKSVFVVTLLKYCCCSVAKLCLTLCDPMDCSIPGFPVLHYLLEFAQTCVHWVSDVLQPSHTLPPPSPPAFSLSQHQGLFQWVGSSHQVVKVLELQLHIGPYNEDSGLTMNSKNLLYFIYSFLQKL